MSSSRSGTDHASARTPRSVRPCATPVAGVVVMAHWQAQSGKGAAVTHDAPRS